MQEEQQIWEPSNLAEAWMTFGPSDAIDDPVQLHEMQACFYGGALALIAIMRKAACTAEAGKISEAVCAVVNAAEDDVRAFFDGEAPDGPVTLKVLEVEAATADELVAKVREVLPVTPEIEEQIRAMHAARAEQIAKRH